MSGMNAFVDPLKRRQKRPLRSLIWLFHPVVLVSLAAHGLFLLIPTSSSSESPTSSEIASETSARSESVTQSPGTPQTDAASALGLAASASDPADALPTTPVSPQPKTGTYVASSTGQPAPTFTPSTTPSQPNPPTSSPVSPQTAIAPSTPLTPSTINQRPNSTTPSPIYPSTPSLPQVSPSPISPRSPAPSPTLSALPSEAPQALIDYVQSLQQQYSYRPNQTSEKAVRKAMATWQREIEAESAIALLDLDLDLNLGSTLDLDSHPAIVRESVTMSYPLVACLSHEPHNATVGLVIDESGTLQTEPKLLQGTGYVGLNQRALERVEQVKFPSTDAPQLYAVDVQIDYSANDCIAAR